MSENVYFYLSSIFFSITIFSFISITLSFLRIGEFQSIFIEEGFFFKQFNFKKKKNLKS